MDSGASRYMTGTHELFTRLSRTDPNLHVELGTQAKCVVKGVGTVKLQLESGGTLEVTNMLYVPELRMNLALILELNDNGYTISFEKMSSLQPIGFGTEST